MPDRRKLSNLTCQKCWTRSKGILEMSFLYITAYAFLTKDLEEAENKYLIRCNGGLERRLSKSSKRRT